MFPVVISELSGDSIVLDTFIDAATTVSYSISAEFEEATACTATAMAGPFDPCLVDLALTKTASTLMPTPGPYEYGDQICMDITVFNQGGQTVDNVQVQDSLPAGFAFDLTDNPGWFDIDPYQLFIFPDPIGPGASAVTTICVTLEMSPGGTGAYTNIAEITSFTDTMGVNISAFDEDSTPDTDFSNDAGGEPNTDSDDSVVGDGSGEPGDEDPATDEDDSDPFEIGVFDLAMVKMLETDTFFGVGDIVEYSFQVINQGSIPAENIVVTDYVPDGFNWVMANETATPPWSPPGTPGAGFTPSTLSIPGTLAPGDTFEFSIQLQVAASAMTETFLRTNIAEISSATGPGGVAVTDIDSTPDSNPTNDAGGVAFSDSDDALATTVTNAAGDYYFGTLIPGNYQIQVTSANFGAVNPLGDNATSSAPTSVTDDNVDGNDDGSQPGGSFTTVSSPVIRLIPTQEPTAGVEETEQGNTQDVDNGQDDENGNMTIDFGFLPNVAIGSTVFADYDNNAMQDAGEPGIPTVTVFLYQDANGDGRPVAASSSCQCLPLTSPPPMQTTKPMVMITENKTEAMAP